MTEVTSTRELPLPTIVPALLSFVAGYVDSYTYLALFGLFAAQVTGSFVIAGAELIRHTSVSPASSSPSLLSWLPRRSPPR
jgi:hypothetical protein